MAQLRNADKAVQQVIEPLSEVFNEFVIVGLRKLEPHEKRKVGETGERPYWFVSGSPVMGGAVLKWALEAIVASMGQDGTLTYMDPDTKELNKLPTADVLKKLMEE